ncbi:MAG: KpsF/GutQ family sugar-phosphate isomerase [Pseudomonadota bacterium]|nr:KpsF/GutQ family sugar-phosphate isomerase [Pseudomonadota bacterium]
MESESSIRLARDVLKIEAESIAGLIDKLDDNFTRAVETIYRSRGRVIVTGIGKSGLIGKKIVATLTSTGTQAIFLHPVEGMHGDLGIVTKRDVVIAISNSGETHELNVIVSSVREIGAILIALTGNVSSTLARSCDLVIDVGVEREACPFGLAPTSSSTAALAMGDALAVALIEKRKFNEADFYKFHPGGNLGARLRARVREVMIAGSQTPKVHTDATVAQAIEEMDINNKGFVLITDRRNILRGIFTDGDLRRLIKRGRIDADGTIAAIMTQTPKTIDENASLAETIEAMQKDEITTLVVVNSRKKLQGYIHLHDILGRGGTLRIAMP